MKGKIIFSVFLFALAGVIFAMQLPDKGPYREATKAEIQKGTALVIVGMFDSDPQSLELDFKKTGDSYRIKEIKDF